MLKTLFKLLLLTFFIFGNTTITWAKDCTTSKPLKNYIQNNQPLADLDNILTELLQEKSDALCQWQKKRDKLLTDLKALDHGFGEYHENCQVIQKVTRLSLKEINHSLLSCNTEPCFNAIAKLQNLKFLTQANDEFHLLDEQPSITLESIQSSPQKRLLKFEHSKLNGLCGALKIQLLFLGDYTAHKNTLLNKAIDQHLPKEFKEIKYSPLEIKTLAKDLFNDHEYDYMYEERPEFEDGQYFSYSQLFYHYTGGAHGNGHKTYINLDKKTGKKVKLKDLLDTKYKDQILQIAKNNFYNHYKLDTKQSLQENGFWFNESEPSDDIKPWIDQEGFYLPDNFLIRADGLLFLYQPYEVAAYAMGMPTVEILWYELDDIGQ